MVRALIDVLEKIGAVNSTRVLVLNKANLLYADRRRELGNRHPDAALVSAVTGEGLDALRDRIEAEFERTLRPMELLLPYAEGGRLAELHDLAGDMERSDTPEGVLVRANVPAGVAERFSEFSTANGNGARP